MSDSQAQNVVQQFLAALNAGNPDGALALVSDDIAHDRREGGREIGKEKFHWALGLSARHFNEELRDIAIMTAPRGVRVAAEFTLVGTYLTTKEGFPEAHGQSYSIPAGMFFEIDDGLITRLTTYLDMALWHDMLKRSAD